MPRSTVLFLRIKVRRESVAGSSQRGFVEDRGACRRVAKQCVSPFACIPIAKPEPAFPGYAVARSLRRSGNAGAGALVFGFALGERSAAMRADCRTRCILAPDRNMRAQRLRKRDHVARSVLHFRCHYFRRHGLPSSNARSMSATSYRSVQSNARILVFGMRRSPALPATGVNRKFGV